MRCRWPGSVVGRSLGSCSIPTAEASTPVTLTRPAWPLRHARIDVAQGQLLGQRADRELLQQPQERAGAWRALGDARRGGQRPVPVHRRVLQPEPSPLHPGIPVPDHVPAELDRTTGSARKGSIRATGWKAENVGHLTAGSQGFSDESAAINLPASASWLGCFGQAPGRGLPNGHSNSGNDNCRPQ